MSSHRHIIFLVNPISGGKAKAKLTKSIDDFCQTNGIAYSILPTEIDAKYNDLREEIKKGNVTDVVICGGDGTVNQVVASLRDLDVVFGIIPSGSGNGLARAARIPTQVDEALKVIAGRHVEAVDAFTFNEHFSCMLSGLGFDAQVAHDFSESKKRGLLSYIIISTKRFFQSKSYRFTVYVKHRPHEVRSFFISVANSNQFGNEITIAPQAHLNDGLLDVVVVSHMSKVKMVWSILKQIQAGKVKLPDPGMEQRDIYYFQTPYLKIINTDRAPMHIDGEPVETAAEIDVNLIPKAFRLIIPSSVLL